MAKQPRVATKQQRFDMIVANSGRCEICGERGNHVHHITPFSKGGATELGNFKLLCKECHKKMHKKTKMKLNFTPYKGQKESWQKVIESPDVFDLIKLPTGYGKTFTGIGCYIVLENAGLVNRCLVVYSSTIQGAQWEKAIDNSAKTFGISYSSEYCENNDWLARETVDPSSDCTFYLASYPLIARKPAEYKKLFNLNNWMVICDEAHHLAGDGEDPNVGNEWSRFLRFGGFKKAIYLSATPHRHDNVPLVGIKYEDVESKKKAIPLVEITQAQSFAEQVNRQPIGRIQQYFVDIDSNDGPLRVTTEFLQTQGYKTFDDFEKTKKGLRYNGNYLSRMVTDALEKYDEKNAYHPEQHQILGFAMTVKHAMFVSNIINEIRGQDFSDWIGENNEKDDKQNSATLDAFNDGDLPCLIQVRKASEGFDNHRASILLFLNLTKSWPQIKQQIGRGLRRNPKIENYNEDVCDIFASGDSEIQDVIKSFEDEFEKAFREEEYKEQKNKKSGNEEEEIYEIIDAEFYRQDDIFLKTHTSIPKETLDYIDILRKSTDPKLQKFNTMSNEDIYSYLCGDSRGHKNKKRKDIKEELTQLSKDIAALYYKEFPPPKESNEVNVEKYKEAVSIFKRKFYSKLHSEWKRVCDGKGIKTNTKTELQSKKAWLENVKKEIRDCGVPSWLRPRQ